VIGHSQHQPEEQPLESKASGFKDPCPLPRQRYHLSMQPDPYIPENQRHSHKQQPQHRITRAGPNSGLVELAVRGFNPEPPPIGLLDPVQGAVSYSPGGIQQGFSLMPMPLSIKVAAHHGQIEADLPLLRAFESVTDPATALELGQRLSTCGPSCFLSSLSGGGHEERLSPTDQIPNDPDAVKASVQEEQTHLEPKGSEPAHQPLHYLHHPLSSAHPTDGQGIAATTEEHVSGGIGEEMGGAVGGLAAADFLLMLGWDTTVIGEPDQINGNPSSFGTQPLGQQHCQKLVEPRLKLIQVVQLAGQFSQDGGARRCSLQLLAGLVDGDSGSCGKEQDVELDLASASLQGELVEDMDGKLVHMVTIEAIIHRRDSPKLGLRAVPIIGGSFCFPRGLFS
jgi:hypothetical protein